MGKKYIVELGRCERLYKALIDGNGKPELAWLSPEIDLTPYTEPDLEQVRKEAYGKGYHDGHNACYETAKDIMEEKKDEAYKCGLADAWETARKIWTTPVGDLKKCFDIEEDDNGMLWPLHEYTASEAIEKIRQYEQEKEEIKVGDEVERILDGEVDSKAVFLEENKGYYHCLFWTGSFFSTLSYPKKQFRKTGRHFPEIAAVLQKMRGDKG